MTNLTAKYLETSLGLTKTLDPADYVFLAEDLELVDSIPLGEQHTHRRWEYAMCIRAIRTWSACRDFTIYVSVMDVGGAGSPLAEIVQTQLHHKVRVIDPKVGTGALEDRPHFRRAVVVSISTIEHVEHAAAFADHLANAVLPGGLLFLTTDIRGGEGPDDRHFHWMRKRIFTPYSFRLLGRHFLAAGFRYFGPPDWSYHGDHVYDYSFASMALVKGRI